MKIIVITDHGSIFASKACKESFVVGHFSTLVLLPLLLDLHIIISSLMMLVLCGIACRLVLCDERRFNSTESQLLF
jgi:hypothetical protein